VQETSHRTEGSCFTWDRKEWKLHADKSWRSPGFTQDDRHPAVCVNWDDAKAYARWLSAKTGKIYQLLSEGEWEYATRGVTTATPQPRYHFGNDAGDLCKYANGADQTAKKTFSDWPVAACEDGFVYTSPVGSFRPNAFGLYDMHGNVWNWTEDCRNASYHGAPIDASARMSGDCGYRVVRGGSWLSAPQVLRSANRAWDASVYRYDNLGFRVGRTLTP
jgi:sulfatase modifying factor 1